MLIIFKYGIDLYVWRSQMKWTRNTVIILLLLFFGFKVFLDSTGLDVHDKSILDSKTKRKGNKVYKKLSEPEKGKKKTDTLSSVLEEEEEPCVASPRCGLFERIGMDPDHGFHGAVPEENVDLFSGNLTLTYRDIYLPGPEGFDVAVYRVYNSKIYRDDFSSDPGGVGTIQQNPYSWVGFGWTMHMGRLHNYDSNEPVIEFPDGRWETAYNSRFSNDNSVYITKGFSKYDKYNYKLHFKDGTVWTFGEVKYVNISNPQVRVVTKIENKNGYEIAIEYHGNDKPWIKKITDSLGREINFEITSDNKLSRIYLLDPHGNEVNYYYNVISIGTYNWLSSYDPPELDPTTFEYGASNGELSAVNLCFGGRLSYVYDNRAFDYYDTMALHTRVVLSKSHRYESGGDTWTWNYTYPDYNGADEASRTVKVSGPISDTYVTYHTLYNNPIDGTTYWQLGLKEKKWVTEPGSSTVLYKEEYEWDFTKLADYMKELYGLNTGYLHPITSPLMLRQTVTRPGDANSIEEYWYGEKDGEGNVLRDLHQYGLTADVATYVNGSMANVKQTVYTFEGTGAAGVIFSDNFLITPVEREKLYDSDWFVQKETMTGYYYDINSIDRNFGTVKEVTKWRGSDYLTWKHTFQGANPVYITKTVDLPGDAGIETLKYHYGALSEHYKPGFTEVTRTISPYTGSMLTETNKFGGILSFQYDSLGRITRIDLPAGFNPITANWGASSVTITQGDSTMTKYWDGMGRNTGFIESGDGLTLYYRKVLDPESRVLQENKGSHSQTDKYTYEYTAAGQVKKVTDPRNKSTTTAYSGNTKTVTDPESKQTVLTYGFLPGLVTQVTDSNNKSTAYQYDDVGRMTQINNYDVSHQHHYNYNAMDQVVSESHPETGTISYLFNNEGNLNSKTFGGVTSGYLYNSSNQLTRFVANTDTDEETVSYEYHDNGTLKSVTSSNKGWNRSNITYNTLGSVTAETQRVPDLGNKTTQYIYDSNGNLVSTIYPGGRTTSYTHNQMNLPNSLSFNSQTLVNSIQYGIQKKPTTINFAGNGTTFNASYDGSGLMQSHSLQKGGTFLYKTVYGYDNTGNIASFSDTAGGIDATFSYDNIYRLTNAVYANGKTFSYSYDDYGNMLSVTEDSATVFSQTYTNQNRFDNVNYVYDSRGNLLQTPGYINYWDSQNRLSSQKFTSGATIAEYTYNENGLRLVANRMDIPPLVLLSPNGGESYLVGGICSICWTQTGVTPVKLEYSTDGGSNYQTIVDSTDNDGQYDWIVPDYVSSTCLVKISETDGDPVDVSNSVFSIIPAGSDSLLITSPAIDEKWEVGTSRQISWISTGTVGNIKIEISTDNGASYSTIVSDIGNSGSYAWTVTDTVSDQCVLRISDMDGAPIDISHGTFWIIPAGTPSVYITSPIGGEQWAPGASENITWNTTGTVGNVKIEYSVDDGGYYIELAASTANDGVFEWTVPASISSRCRVRISETDGDPTDTSERFSIYEDVPFDRVLTGDIATDSGNSRGCG